MERDPKAAEKEFRRAVELNPWMPSARYGLALALLDQGDSDGARKELEAALDGFAEPDVKELAEFLLSHMR
jgi:Flp pilus assembly protein TadD